MRQEENKLKECTHTDCQFVDGYRYCYKCKRRYDARDLNDKVYRKLDFDLKDHHDPTNPFRLDIGGEG